MSREDIDKVAVSIGIVFLSGLVLFQSCHRASTIYFFELQTTTVIFIEPLPALLVPFALSALLWLVYKGTRRSASLEVERKAIMDKRKELEILSTTNSRKTSRNGSRKVSMIDDLQFCRLNRLLSNIQEQDTIHSTQEEPSDRDSLEGETKEAPEENDESFRSPNEEDRKPGGASPKPSTSESIVIVCPETALLGVSRKSSVGSFADRRYAGADPYEEDSERDRNEIYKQIGQTNLFTYSLSALNLFQKDQPGLPELKLNFSDIMSELFAVHLPMWACVAAFYIVLLELFGIQFAYYFYYHEEMMVYSALTFSIMFGLFHEFYGGWVTNDILAFSSIYIVCSRIQAVSYQAGVVLLVGMAIYDVFWLYVIDLMSSVTRECRAPLIIMIPCDHRGNKQSLATMDIIISAVLLFMSVCSNLGIFLNVIQKYSSMYDPELFAVTYAAVFGALTVTMIFSVWRQKTTPVLLLPAIMGIVVSLALCTHRNDLWRFMIKYKRMMPARRV